VKVGKLISIILDGNDGASRVEQPLRFNGHDSIPSRRSWKMPAIYRALRRRGFLIENGGFI
jgi:hypothetical protein